MRQANTAPEAEAVPGVVVAAKWVPGVWVGLDVVIDSGHGDNRVGSLLGYLVAGVRGARGCDDGAGPGQKAL